MNDKCLICMVGLPRSGKSTIAQNMGHPIVCPDAIRLALHGKPFVSEAEAMVWVMARYMVRSLFLAGHGVVILDATNITKKRRAAWLTDQWATRFSVVETDVTECLRRAKEEKRQDLVPVIERMNAQYEPLGVKEIRMGWIE